jgi:catechol 2,3-dioxygenase-like lactoylglutathione lyase family enzyme
VKDWNSARCYELTGRKSLPDDGRFIGCFYPAIGSNFSYGSSLSQDLNVVFMVQTRRNWLSKLALAFAGAMLAGSKTFALPAANIPRKLTGESLIPLTPQLNIMKPGAFSVSLNVKDLKASKEFYENLGFVAFGGDLKKNYLIMKNGNALIGLFHGMFDKTILTFNPGWDENAKKVEKFDDVRTIQKNLKSKGVALLTEADEKTSGPASLMLADPDGNQILFDQHV